MNVRVIIVVYTFISISYINILSLLFGLLYNFLSLSFDESLGTFLMYENSEILKSGINPLNVIESGDREST